jgi:hypothetical protein
MLPAELSFLSPNSSHIVLNVSPLKCLILLEMFASPLESEFKKM